MDHLRRLPAQLAQAERRLQVHVAPDEMPADILPHSPPAHVRADELQSLESVGYVCDSLWGGADVVGREADIPPAMERDDQPALAGLLVYLVHLGRVGEEVLIHRVQLDARQAGVGDAADPLGCLGRGRMHRRQRADALGADLPAPLQYAAGLVGLRGDRADDGHVYVRGVHRRQQPVDRAVADGLPGAIRLKPGDRPPSQLVREGVSVYVYRSHGLVGCAALLHTEILPVFTMCAYPMPG